MRNILIKLIFIVILIFCFIKIDVMAESITYDSSYDFIDLNNECVLNIRDIVGMDKSEIIPSCDVFNRYLKYKDVIVVDEEVNSSKNVIILLIVLIIIGGLYLIIFDKNE